jgi:aspartyl-tRNA(Asn)/glutamyl-tRNA(Gln) amidotransferase subunit C
MAPKSTQITSEEVAHIAQLARLSLSPEEAVGMQQDLGRILEYVEMLQELDTTGVVPTAHALIPATPTRPDEPCTPLDPELAVSNAPARAGTAFLVPKVIDEDAS